MTDADRLEAALDQLHHCILAANFGDLPKILVETERLAAQLPPPTDRDFAIRLRAKADRNAQCLQAAARGLRAAQRRIGDIAVAGKNLTTYTRQGARAEIDTGLGTLAKRL